MKLERDRGLEPLSLAWKAKAQPIYQTRIVHGWTNLNQTGHLAHLDRGTVVLEDHAGLEPATLGVRIPCSTY